MKKLICIFCLIIFMFSISSCESKSYNTDGIGKDFSSNVSVKFGNNKFEGKLKRSVNGISSLSLHSPKELDNVTVQSDGEKISVLYGDMTVDISNEYIGATSFCSLLFKVLDSLRNNENVISSDGEKTILKGNIEEGEFVTLLSSDGRLNNIDVESAGFSAELSDFKFD